MTHFEVEIRSAAGGWLLKPERFASLPLAVAKAATIRADGTPPGSCRLSGAR